MISNPQPIASPLTPADQSQALTAARSDAVVINRSTWGRLMLAGDEAHDFLHNQSTNDFKTLSSGQGCDTVFITATAQILDLTTAYVTDTGILLITSPERRQFLFDHLSRFIRFVRGASLEDQSDQTALLTLIGPRSQAILTSLGWIDPEFDQRPLHSHVERPITIQNHSRSIRIAVGNGLGLPGFNLILPIDQVNTVETHLIEAGATLADLNVWEILRVEQGRAAADREMIDPYNPLEAGLWQAISLSKGCYIGQEVLAKQVTYQRIRQELWGIKLDHPVEVGSPVHVADDKVGQVTSVIATPAGALALAYIRTKIEPTVGLAVQIGDHPGELIQLPLLNFPPV